MVPRKLPSDLEEEILFRVPPLSLHRFRSVCKEWNTLFNNKRFVHKNLACGPQEFMLRTHSHIYSISVDLNDDPTIKVRDRFELSGHRYHLEGTYDGNFFMYDFYKGGRGVVSNPLLRQTRWIPADEIICSMSMGYDGSRPETSYSIIGDNSYNTDHLAGKVTRRFAVFEFATNAWKITNHTSFHKESHSELIVSNSDRVSLNGNLYWTAYNYNETGQYFIIMLDFSKEIEKRRIFCILPFKGKKACTHTRGLAIYKGDRFSALEQCARTREIEIWVTKNKIGNGDDGDNVVWIKFMTVSIPNFPLVCHNMSSSYFVDNNIYGKSFVMCCLNEKPKQAWIYIVRGDVCKKIKVDEVLCEFLSYVYVPSLITIS